MRYNFDDVISRKNTNSYKWDTVKNEGILPMWVADMDFRTAQPIIDALVQRAEHGIFGYANVPEVYYDAVVNWFSKRHNFVFNKKWLLYTIGVVPALSAIIRALTVSGDKVMVQSPVYNCFFSSILNNDCEIVSNDLIYQNGTYLIDFADLEVKARDPKVKLFLLCSPHNPVGRVWKKEELERVGEICIRNNVLVVSDEIHCDLVYRGNTHIPFASINEHFLKHSVTCTAPSKSFNLAGLQVANILAADDAIRKRINKALNINEVCDISPFAIEAVLAAYMEGEEWLDQLKQYLYDNYLYLKDFFSENLKQFPVLELEATYLVWVDCSADHKSSQLLTKMLLEEQRLFLNEGTIYGSGGEMFLRINIACPKTVLMDGLNRFKQAFA
jgi:cystathionine beta-lyase